MVVCQIDMRFGPAETEHAIQVLLSVVERIRVKNGCEDCTVSRDSTDPNRIRYDEIWKSESAFGAHVRSQEFRFVLAAMDMCSKKPRVVCGGVSGPSGLGYLRDLHGNFEVVLEPKA
mgnify:CR=1 FL=1